MPAARHVLVIGYRPQIATRLHQLGIPFDIWHDRPIKKQQIAGSRCVIDDSPFLNSISAIKQQLTTLFPADSQYSHVIAGTESSVVTASVARRAFGSRKSKNTVILRCHNKRMMKEFLRDKGFPLIPFLYSGSRSDCKLTTAQIVAELGLPVVVKQLNTSGGRGMAIVHTEADLQPYLHQKVLFEKWIDAPEVSVESFISGRNHRFMNITQYVEKTLVNLVPSGHDSSVHQSVGELNRRVLMALNIEWGLTHAEYYLANDQIYFGEIAIRPPGGYIMDLISLAYGFNAWDHFVDNELELPMEFSHAATFSAAAILFDPGAGTLVAVDGAAAIESDPRCQKLHLFVGPGDTIFPRQGVSDVAGFALFRGLNTADVLNAVAQCKTGLKFQIEK